MFGKDKNSKQKGLEPVFTSLKTYPQKPVFRLITKGV